MQETSESQLRRLVEPLLADQCLELVELSCRPRGRQLYVRVLVEAEAGVSIEQCARLNRLIGQQLEEAQWTDSPYTVEVSSPGIDRPLKSPRDFSRVCGKIIRVETVDTQQSGKMIQGTLESVYDSGIRIQTGSGVREVSFGKIRLAKIALPW